MVVVCSGVLRYQQDRSIMDYGSPERNDSKTYPLILRYHVETITRNPKSLKESGSFSASQSTILHQCHIRCYTVLILK